MGFLLNEQATGQCSHGGAASPMVGNPRVKVNGSPVLTVATQFAVQGCPNTVGTSPFPCVVAVPVAGAARVRVMGQPVLLDTSTPRNLPTAASTTLPAPQARVKGQ